MKHLRYIAMTLLATSDWPSDWGWNAELICSFVPVALNSTCQNAEVNTRSRSETIEVGIPCRRKTLPKNALATVSAVYG